MASQLASFVGKRILKENATNKFGQEVRANMRLGPDEGPLTFAN
jgi:hypothetical protein